MNLSHSETTADHQGEDSLVTRRGDDREKVVEIVVCRIAGQAMARFEAVPAGDDRVDRWGVQMGGQELVEGAEGCYSAVDSGHSVPLLRPGVSDVGVDIADGNFVGRFASPDEELL